MSPAPNNPISNNNDTLKSRAGVCDLRILTFSDSETCSAYTQNCIFSFWLRSLCSSPSADCCMWVRIKKKWTKMPFKLSCVFFFFVSVFNLDCCCVLSNEAPFYFVHFHKHRGGLLRIAGSFFCFINAPKHGIVELGIKSSGTLYCRYK